MGCVVLPHRESCTLPTTLFWPHGEIWVISILPQYLGFCFCKINIVVCTLGCTFAHGCGVGSENLSFSRFPITLGQVPARNAKSVLHEGTKTVSRILAKKRKYWMDSQRANCISVRRFLPKRYVLHTLVRYFFLRY